MVIKPMTPEGQDLAAVIAEMDEYARYHFSNYVERWRKRLALLLAEAQRVENKEVTTRVEDSQYPSKPLATASENELGPTELTDAERDLGRHWHDAYERMAARAEKAEAMNKEWFHAAAIQHAAHQKTSPYRTDAGWNAQAIAALVDRAEKAEALSMSRARDICDLEHQVDTLEARIAKWGETVKADPIQYYDELAALPETSAQPQEENQKNDQSRVDSVPGSAHGDLPRRATR